MISMIKKYNADVTVVGGGLAGLVAVHELLNQKKKVLLLERDLPDKLGGLARESFGGILLVDTPLQRRQSIKDSVELAYSDWCSYAEFSEQDHWPKKWARYYVEQSQDIIYRWFCDQKIRFD